MALLLESGRRPNTTRSTESYLWNPPHCPHKTSALWNYFYWYASHNSGCIQRRGGTCWANKTNTVIWYSYPLTQVANVFVIDVHHPESTTDGCSYDIKWHFWVGFFFQFIILEINQSMVKDLYKSHSLKDCETSKLRLPLRTLICPCACIVRIL